MRDLNIFPELEYALAFAIIFNCHIFHDEGDKSISNSPCNDFLIRQKIETKDLNSFVLPIKKKI